MTIERENINRKQFYVDIKMLPCSIFSFYWYCIFFWLVFLKNYNFFVGKGARNSCCFLEEKYKIPKGWGISDSDQTPVLICSFCVCADNFHGLSKLCFSGIASEYFTTLQRKSHLFIPFLGIARPQPQFPHSCVCERLLQSQDRSTYFPSAK